MINVDRLRMLARLKTGLAAHEAGLAKASIRVRTEYRKYLTDELEQVWEIDWKPISVNLPPPLMALLGGAMPVGRIFTCTMPCDNRELFHRYLAFFETQTDDTVPMPEESYASLINLLLDDLVLAALSTDDQREIRSKAVGLTHQSEQENTKEDPRKREDKDTHPPDEHMEEIE